MVSNEERGFCETRRLQIFLAEEARRSDAELAAHNVLYCTSVDGEMKFC